MKFKMFYSKTLQNKNKKNKEKKAKLTLLLYKLGHNF